MLLRALTKPETCKHIELEEWETLIRCARVAKLIATLGFKFESSGVTQWVPEQALRHIQAAQKLVEYRQRLATWELNRVNKALSGLDVDIVVLKGGAYIISGQKMARGRTVSDLDILVARRDLERVEKRLLEQGWQSAKLDAYDQHYYRAWMHEIPPLRHRDRHIEVDIHHTILPLTGRFHPDPELLLKDAITVKGYNFKILAPCDMVLHSTVHLFYDAELNSGDFRNLVDLHELMTVFSHQDQGFWKKLNKRAGELELSRPLYYTLYFSKLLLGTPIPEDRIINHKGRPSIIVRRVMNCLVPLALLPEHPDFLRKRVGFARWLLYIRSHYLRMPLYLLVPHLVKKSMKRLEQNNADELTRQQR